MMLTLARIVSDGIARIAISRNQESAIGEKAVQQEDEPDGVVLDDMNAGSLAEPRPRKRGSPGRR